MKKNAKARTKRRRTRFVVGYIGTGNLLYGKKNFNTGVGTLDEWPMSERLVKTNFPLTLTQARSVLAKMPCADCAIFELVPVEVNR